jgi:hypothetical protein
MVLLCAPRALPLRLYIVPEFCFEEIKFEIINTGKVLLASKCVPRVKSACGRSPAQLLPNFRFFPLFTHQDLLSCQISSFYDIGKCIIILMSESVGIKISDFLGPFSTPSLKARTSEFRRHNKLV